MLLASAIGPYLPKIVISWWSFYFCFVSQSIWKSLSVSQYIIKSSPSRTFQVSPVSVTDCFEFPLLFLLEHASSSGISCNFSPLSAPKWALPNTNWILQMIGRHHCHDRTHASSIKFRISMPKTFQNRDEERCILLVTNTSPTFTKMSSYVSSTHFSS